MHLSIIFHHIFIIFAFFSDPDLKIEVDLAREEEEKNGRREYSNFPLHTEPILLARFRVKRTVSARGIHATWDKSFCVTAKDGRGRRTDLTDCDGERNVETAAARACGLSRSGDMKKSLIRTKSRLLPYDE